MIPHFCCLGGISGIFDIPFFTSLALGRSTVATENEKPTCHLLATRNSRQLRTREIRA